MDLNLTGKSSWVWAQNAMITVKEQTTVINFNVNSMKVLMSLHSINTFYGATNNFMMMLILKRGEIFKIFKHKIGDTTSINDDYISQIIQGPRHTLWVLTRNGWNIFDPRTEKFT